MAWTQIDLDRIDAAIASGTVTVQTSDGRRITRRSVSELLQLRSLVASELATNLPKRRRRYAEGRSGF